MTDFKRAKKEIEDLRYENSLSVQEVIRLFKKYKPEDRRDIKDMGLKLKLLGSGLFRRGYRINGLPVVVKIPKEDGENRYESNRIHAIEEIQKIRTIRKTKKYRPFWRYLPEVLYFDENSGVILMPEYGRLKESEANLFSSFLSNLADDLGRDDENDMHDENVGWNFEKEEYVILDLGYF